MRIFDSLKKIVAALVFILCFQLSYSQSHRFEIPSQQRRVDGITLGIKPGDTIFLLPGNRTELRLENITGTEDKPVIVANKDKKVIIHTTAPFGIAVSNSVHIRLTGTGGKDQYGIEIAATGNQGVTISEFSSYVEVDHLEIHHVGFAGIMAKTDPNCDRKDLRYFVMNNISLHDNYIYETKGEGFYVGYSWYPTRQYKCGEDSLLYPHQIHGVRLYNNIIRDTHWDGLQVGSSTSDVKIYNNTIDNYGVDDVLWQDHGVQIGAGTTGDFFNNRINKGTGDGISFFGIGGNRLYNNLILNAGDQAIYQNDRDAITGKSYQIINNTIINPKEAGITLNAISIGNNTVANNLIVIQKTTEAIRHITDKWTAENNLALSTIGEAGFLFPDTLDFRLKTASTAVNKGTTIGWLKFDYLYGTRPAEKLFDVGAFEYNAKAKPAPTFPFDKDPCGMIIDLLPVLGTYTFNVSAKNSKDPFSYIVYDGTGRIIKSEVFKEQPKTIFMQTTGLIQGIYYMALYSGRIPIALRRFIKQQQ